jgi:hypothetical protein
MRRPAVETVLRQASPRIDLTHSPPSTLNVPTTPPPQPPAARADRHVRAAPWDHGARHSSLAQTLSYRLHDHHVKTVHEVFASPTAAVRAVIALHRLHDTPRLAPRQAQAHTHIAKTRVCSSTVNTASHSTARSCGNTDNEGYMFRTPRPRSRASMHFSATNKQRAAGCQRPLQSSTSVHADATEQT